jgi:hypothetical protein
VSAPETREAAPPSEGSLADPLYHSVPHYGLRWFRLHSQLPHCYLVRGVDVSTALLPFTPLRRLHHIVENNTDRLSLYRKGKQWRAQSKDAYWKMVATCPISH